MDKMGEINREILLGYLMNALEDDEISRVQQELLRRPELRDELAKLQEELSPLSSMYETVEPPPNLARRTCDRIWAHAEREERAGEFANAGFGRIVSLSLPSPHFDTPVDVPADERPAVARLDRLQVVEELVAASPHLSPDLPEEHSPEEGPKRLVRQREKKAGLRKAVGKSRRAKRGRWVDVFTAGAVGILIALVVFPAINFSKNKIHSHLAQNKMREINQNVDRYTASQAMAEEPAGPQNFFHYGWQEIKPDRIPLLVFDETENPSSDAEPTATPDSTEATLLAADESRTEPLAESLDGGVLLGQATADRGMIFGPMQQIGLNEPTEPAGQSIFSNVGQLMPVSNSPMLQPAYGQNVIFHNGRIFVRRLPEVTPSE